MKNPMSRLITRVLGPSSQDILDQILEDHRAFHREMMRLCGKPDAEEVMLESSLEARREGRTAC